MYSRAKIAGHPIHPMLIPFPIAFYTATLVSLLVFAGTEDPFWYRVAIVANIAGVAMATLAAIPGLVDYVKGIPRGTRAAATARNHALLNVTALIFFVINAFYVYEGWRGALPDSDVAIVLSALGLASTLGAGWFGWKLTQTHAVGIQEPEALESGTTGGTPFEARPQPR